MEENVQEAVKTNIFGTYNVASASALYGTNKFVMISTDKAVNPTSVMGASKRVAEMVVQSMNLLGTRTQFVSVRFGNVLGSRGSVVPVFRRQIAQGGPVTVTHPDMMRYFMTIREAVQLVLQAGTMGKGGEIFVLDMGEPVRILDMAEQMIRLSGRTPYTEIPIVFTGVRQGEKLFEEILSSEEGASATQHSQILVAKQNGFCMEGFLGGLGKLERLVFPENLSFRILDEEKGLPKIQADQVRGNPWSDVSAERILEVLRELVPEFNCSRLSEESQSCIGTESSDVNRRILQP
jgi:FlaA1/EpsC-like NDP-sugar epimerase